MRVLPQIRARFPKGQAIPADLDTAHIYLANADAQTGFQQSVEANAKIISELEGQTEKLVTRETVNGALVITNRLTPQGQAFYDAPLPATQLIYGGGGTDVPAMSPDAAVTVEPVLVTGPPGTQSGFDLSAPDAADANADIELDEVKPTLSANATRRARALNTAEAITAELSERGLRVYPLRSDLPALPRAFLREERPILDNMNAISKAIANRVELPESVRNMAVAVALNRAKGIERATELTTGALTVNEIAIVTDRAHLAADAWAALRELPQTEEADHRVIVQTLALRLVAAIREKFEDVRDDDQPNEKAINQYARDAAFWVVPKQADLLAEQLQDEIAKQSKIVESGPLPDAMLFPEDLLLAHSNKNIYGVLPPTKDLIDKSKNSLFIDSEAWFTDLSYPLLGSARFVTSPYDESSKLNGFERQFAEALDRAPFVHWWHRNADRKPHCVAIVRADHKHYFYPDFVVCMAHSAGDDALLRLIETKDNTKDAARKARHTPQRYGSVLFITQDGQRIKIINRDGSLGDIVDTDDLATVQDWLRQTRPTV